MEPTPVLKTAAKAALAAMILLLAGALLFYKERMLFIDAPFIISDIINRHSLVIQEHRYGSFITQVFPLVCASLHVPVKLLLVLYSASFNLFYLVVALLLYRWKNYTLLLLFALYFFVFSSDSFFWTNNELYQGIGWMFLSLGILLRSGQSEGFKAPGMALFLVVAALAIFTHPLIMPVFAFFWGLLWIRKEGWPYSRRTSVILTALLALILVVKFLLSNTANSYDEGKMHNVTHISLRDIIAAMHNGGAKTFVKDCLKNYWLIFPITATGAWAMFRQRAKWAGTWILLAAMGYALLITLSFHDAYDYHTRFYMESEWMPWALIITAPFVFYFLPRLKGMQAAWCLAGIVTVRSIYILCASSLFTARVSSLQQLLRYMETKEINKAVIVKKDSRLDDRLIMTWAMPNESCILSALNGDKIQKQATSMGEGDVKTVVPGDTKSVIWNWNVILQPADLNQNYFVPDSTQLYKVLQYEDIWP